jgi:hypothetical protein
MIAEPCNSNDCLLNRTKLRETVVSLTKERDEYRDLLHRASDEGMLNTLNTARKENDILKYNATQLAKLLESALNARQIGGWDYDKWASLTTEALNIFNLKAKVSDSPSYIKWKPFEKELKEIPYKEWIAERVDFVRTVFGTPSQYDKTTRQIANWFLSLMHRYEGEQK